MVRLETRPDNLEGHGAVRQRQLLINSLRMRPDRIIVGEVRGEEALDMLQAMNTGHDGSLTTVHANTPRDAVSRLEVMVTLANGNMHLAAIRQQIASAVHILVQCSRLSDGSRRVTSITEVTGMEGEIVTLQDIFVFEKRGLSHDGKVRGRFCATGILPKFNEKLAGRRDCACPSEIFDEDGRSRRPLMPVLFLVAAATAVLDLPPALAAPGTARHGAGGAAAGRADVGRKRIRDARPAATDRSRRAKCAGC